MNPVKINIFLLIGLYACGCGAKDLTVDKAAELAGQKLLVDQLPLLPHPLALKIMVGSLADSDPNIIVGIRLRALERSNGSADYNVSRRSDWVELEQKEDNACVFSYRELGKLKDGGILFQCIDREGGTLWRVAFLICDVAKRIFYVEGCGEKYDTVLIFRGSFGGLDEGTIHQLLKRLGQPPTDQP